MNLGIRFVAILPRQLVGGTEIGHAGASAYAAQQGITEQKFMERMGAPLTPEIVGQSVVSLLTEQTYREGISFDVTSQGLAALN